MLYFAHLTMIMRFGLTLEIKRKLRNSVIVQLFELLPFNLIDYLMFLKLFFII